MAYNLLIVDDSSAALMILKKVISLTGIAVQNLYSAKNGKEGLAILSTHPVDLVITDIHMPEMDGFEMIAHIRRSPSFAQVPVIVVTTEGRENYFQQAQHLGVAEFLKKPFAPEDLRRTILQIMGVQANETINNDAGDGDF